jgi:Flp pilus assembly protein TadG
VAKLNKTSRKRRGVALVELAIALPLLLAITFGIMEYGWMFLKAHQIANAARQGARVGARADSTTADVTAAVNAALTASSIPTGAPTTFVVQTPNPVFGMPVGNQFSVRITVQYSGIGLGLPLIPTPATLKSEVIMAREGP